MPRTRRDCPLCGKKNLAKLSNHLSDMHHLPYEERRYYLSKARSRSDEHESDYDEMSSQEKMPDESDDEMSTTSDEDVSTPSDEGENSESSETGDMSDGENEIDPWASLIDDAASGVREAYEELFQTLIADGQEESAAKKKAFENILPQLQRELADVYLDNLQWIRALKEDPVHKTIMKTRDAFVNEDDFDHDEALSAAVDKRKFLLKRLLENRKKFPGDSDESDTSD